MTPLTQQVNQILNAQNRGFVEGVITTTEIYVIGINSMLNGANLRWGSLTVKSEVIRNLTKLKMSTEDIEYWINEYFSTKETE